MNNTDLSYLIPPEFDDLDLPVKSKSDFKFMGQETILFLSACWYKLASDLFDRGLTSETIDDRMVIVAQAQEFRKYGDELQELAIEAPSKPLLFKNEVFRTGDHVTCFIYRPSDNLRGDLKKPNRFLDTVILRTDQCNEKTIYSVALRNRENKKGVPKRYRFVPDRVSAIATGDFHYLKTHPRFFRLYLSTRARSDAEREKIEPILKAI